jgi:hypothetical protein
MSRIPNIPGRRIPHGSDQDVWLKGYVARLCRLDHHRYVPHTFVFASDVPVTPLTL